MKKLLLILACVLAMGATAPAERDEAQYTADITKRADDIIALLHISDSAQADKVRGVIVTQYRSLRSLQDARDAKIKDLGDDKDAIANAKADTAAQVKQLHEKYLANLADAGLSPQQIETVKDKMVYGKVKVTYDAYNEIYGPLTPEQQSHMMDLLKQAREEAMDGGSSQEKDLIFKKYKGKINIYLSGQGINMKQMEKAWGEKQKAKRAATTKSVA
jgi:Spy/CpxP family protein refolding chaperone